MATDPRQFVSPSAPPRDICPSSPPPSYQQCSSSSPNTNGNSDTIHQQQQGTTTKNILSSCNSAKNGGQVNGDSVARDQTSFCQTTVDTVVVVPVPKDKVTILCVDANRNQCGGDCAGRPLRHIGCHRCNGRFAIVPCASVRSPTSNRMRQVLAFSCCAFSIVFFGFFAFLMAFIFLALAHSPPQPNYFDAFRQQEYL